MTTEAPELAELALEAPIVQQLLEPYHLEFTNGALSTSDYLGLFILTYISHRRSRKWCSGLSKVPLSGKDTIGLTSVVSKRLMELSEPLQSVLDLQYIAKKFRALGPTVEELRVVDIFNHLTLSGERPVCLLHHIPSPMEVLKQQARGERVVTLFRTVEELSHVHIARLTYMSGDRAHARDAFYFLLHDLRHMEHFTHLDTHFEQVGFFSAMLSLHNGSPKQLFLRQLGHPRSLWQELEYVISDMNCYCSHLLRYLHAKWYISFQAKSQSTTEADSEGSGDSEDEAMEEWRIIVQQLFALPTSSSDQVDVHVGINASEEDRDDEVMRQMREVHGGAVDAACLLLEVSRRRCGELTMEQWETVRRYFTLRGQWVANRQRREGGR